MTQMNRHVKKVKIALYVGQFLLGVLLIFLQYLRKKNNTVHLE